MSVTKTVQYEPMDETLIHFTVSVHVSTPSFGVKQSK